MNAACLARLRQLEVQLAPRRDDPERDPALDAFLKLLTDQELDALEMAAGATPDGRLSREQIAAVLDALRR